MPLKVGSGGIAAAYVGSTAIAKAYVGSTLVFETGGGEPEPVDFDRLVYDHAVDGDQTSIVVTGLDTQRCILFIRDVTFASSDRLGIYVSGDDGVTKEESAAEYEGMTVLVQSGLNDPAFTFSCVNFCAARASDPHDAIVKIDGMGSQAARTLFSTRGSNGAEAQIRHYSRATARVENALVIESLGGNPMKSGQIVVRTLPDDVSIDLALTSLWVGAVT